MAKWTCSRQARLSYSEENTKDGNQKLRSGQRKSCAFDDSRFLQVVFKRCWFDHLLGGLLLIWTGVNICDAQTCTCAHVWPPSDFMQKLIRQLDCQTTVFFFHPNFRLLRVLCFSRMTRLMVHFPFSWLLEGSRTQKPWKGGCCNGSACALMSVWYDLLVCDQSW